MYTPAEISTIADKYKELVAARKINIELDAFGDPVQQYSRAAMEQLSEAIKRLPNFPRNDVVENAMREATTDFRGELFQSFLGEIPQHKVMSCVAINAERYVNEAALCEISEHLFTQSQIKDMLREHPDYLDMVQQDIREGKLLQNELDDLRKAS